MGSSSFIQPTSEHAFSLWPIGGPCGLCVCVFAVVVRWSEVKVMFRVMSFTQQGWWLILARPFTRSVPPATEQLYWRAFVFYPFYLPSPNDTAPRYCSQVRKLVKKLRRIGEDLERSEERSPLTTLLSVRPQPADRPAVADNANPGDDNSAYLLELQSHPVSPHASLNCSVDDVKDYLQVSVSRWQAGTWLIPCLSDIYTYLCWEQSACVDQHVLFVAYFEMRGGLNVSQTIGTSCPLFSRTLLNIADFVLGIVLTTAHCNAFEHRYLGSLISYLCIWDTMSNELPSTNHFEDPSPLYMRGSRKQIIISCYSLSMMKYKRISHWDHT